MDVGFGFVSCGTRVVGFDGASVGTDTVFVVVVVVIVVVGMSGGIDDRVGAMVDSLVGIVTSVGEVKIGGGIGVDSCDGFGISSDLVGIGSSVGVCFTVVGVWIGVGNGDGPGVVNRVGVGAGLLIGVDVILLGDVPDIVSSVDGKVSS